MSSMPPDNGDPEDVDAIYRRWSAADTARPSSDAAKKILANAAAVALEVQQRSAQRRWTHRRRTVAFAGLAAAAFAGLLVTPLLFHSHPAAELSVENKPVATLAPSLDAAVRQSSALAAKDTVARFARSRENPAPTSSAPGAANLHEPLASSNTSDAKENNAELAYDGSLIAGSRGAVAAPDRAQHLDRNEALRRAATIGDDADVAALLEKPIDINSRDSDGRTPLMLAVAGGRERVVTLLLEHGADPNAPDAYGETPLRAALTTRHPLIEAALRRAGAR